MIFEKLEERLGRSAEEHRKIWRDGILGGAVGGRNVGQIESAPVWNSRCEQTGLGIFWRDRLVHDRMASNSGERGRDLVVAVRYRAGQRVCLAGVCGGVAENDRCGSANIAGVDQGKTGAAHRSGKPSFMSDRMGSAQQILHIEVRLEERPACRTFPDFFIDFVVLAH